MTSVWVVGMRFCLCYCRHKRFKNNHVTTPPPKSKVSARWQPASFSAYRFSKPADCSGRCG